MISNGSKVSPSPLNCTAMGAYFGTLIAQIRPIRNRNSSFRWAVTNEMFLSTVGHPAMDTIIGTLHLGQSARTGRNVKQFVFQGIHLGHHL